MNQRASYTLAIAALCLLVGSLVTNIPGESIVVYTNLLMNWLSAGIIVLLYTASLTIIGFGFKQRLAPNFSPDNNWLSILVYFFVGNLVGIYVLQTLSFFNLITTPVITILFFTYVLCSCVIIKSLGWNISREDLASNIGTDNNYLLFATVGLSFPILFILLGQSFAYDVLEYHLGGPKLWIENNNLNPVKGLFYTGLPSNLGYSFAFLEILKPNQYFLNSKTLCIFYLLLFLISLVVFAEDLSGNKPLLALLPFLVLCSNAFFNSSIDANNDVAASLSCLVAIWLVLKYKYFGLAGVLFGCTLGFKITYLTLFAPTFLIIILYESISSSNIRGLGKFLLGGLVAFMPWLVRGMVYSGHPLFPLTQIGAPIDALAWSDVQSQSYALHHHLAFPWSSEYISRLGNQLIRSELLIPVILIAIGTAAINQSLERIDIYLILFIAGSLLSWNLLGSSPVRFLITTSVLSYTLLFRYWERVTSENKRVSVVLYIVVFVVGIFVFLSRIQAFDYLDTTESIVQTSYNDTHYFTPMQKQNLAQWEENQIFETLEKLDVSSPESPSSTLPKLLLIYEARIAAIPYSAHTVTVHDAFPLEYESWESLHDLGFTHVLANEWELIRLAQFYPPGNVGSKFRLISSPLNKKFYFQWNPLFLSDQIHPDENEDVNHRSPEIIQNLITFRQDPEVIVGKPAEPETPSIYIIDVLKALKKQ